MPLPGADINFTNGQLGQLIDTPDGVFGLIASAVAVATSFVLATPYQVRGMSDVAALGIVDSVENHVLYKTLSEFYAEAGDGTELWLMGMARTTKVSDWFTPDDATGKAPAEKLLDVAKGNISMLFTAFNPTGYEVTVTDGLDADVWQAATKAQTLAENYTATKYAPFYTLLEGYGFDGDKTTLKDLSTMDCNRVQIMLGDTETRTGTTASKGASVGQLAGRKAKIAIQVNPGRKTDGAVANLNAYILDTPAEQYDVTALHDNGYVTFRTHTGSSGYFFTHDPLATSADDDYRYGTHRRVIDKAYRLAHQRVSNYTLADLNLNPNGTLDAIDAKKIESDIIETIYNSMALPGALSLNANDAKDRGCICVIDLTHNVAQTDRIKFSKLQVRRKGYAAYFSIPLGFAPINNN